MMTLTAKLNHRTALAISEVTVNHSDSEDSADDANAAAGVSFKPTPE